MLFQPKNLNENSSRSFMSEPIPRRWLRRNLIILTPLLAAAFAYPIIWKGCVKISYDANYVTYWYTNPITSKLLGRSDYFLNEDVANYSSFYNSGDEKSWQGWKKVDHFFQYEPFILMERIHQTAFRIHTCHPTRYLTKAEAENLINKK